MKSKITSVLMLLAAPFFAFAETPAPEAVPAPAEKPVVCEKAKPNKGAFVQHILLSLSDEQLNDLAQRVAAVQKMTPEEKAEARKALPKLPMPKKMKWAPGKCFKGKPGFHKGPCGKRFHHGKPGFGHGKGKGKCCGKPGMRKHGKPGFRHGKGKFQGKPCFCGKRGKACPKPAPQAVPQEQPKAE